MFAGTTGVCRRTTSARHAEAGYDILKGIDFPWPIAEFVRQHHERLDGSGYPRGLRGDEICLEAQIIGVADAVEAMAADRPYRFGRGLDAAPDDLVWAGSGPLPLPRPRGGT
ncbi:MAG: HD domain-containing protein [Acidobacteria bacterium]|nr:HD domain-containing protein [Acidobacteriota bacterium]